MHISALELLLHCLFDDCLCLVKSIQTHVSERKIPMGKGGVRILANRLLKFGQRVRMSSDGHISICETERVVGVWIHLLRKLVSLDRLDHIPAKRMISGRYTQSLGVAHPIAKLIRFRAVFTRGRNVTQIMVGRRQQTIGRGKVWIDLGSSFSEKKRLTGISSPVLFLALGVEAQRFERGR